MTDFDLDSASSQLRVIRSLMERATIYRSLSAPTALVGGLLSFGGLGLAYAVDRFRDQDISDVEFLAVWLSILVLAGATNGFVLWREAQRRGTAFFSAGMKCAFKSLLPPFVCAGLLTITVPVPQVQAFAWILFYGLGLLAMQHFAPRSIVVLGWAFVLSFAVGWLIAPHISDAWQMNHDDGFIASLIMALTFGLFHIVYAVAVWATGEKESRAAEAGEAEHV